MKLVNLIDFGRTVAIGRKEPWFRAVTEGKQQIRRIAMCFRHLCCKMRVLNTLSRSWGYEILLLLLLLLLPPNPCCSAPAPESRSSTPKSRYPVPKTRNPTPKPRAPTHNLRRDRNPRHCWPDHPKPRKKVRSNLEKIREQEVADFGWEQEPNEDDE